MYYFLPNGQDWVKQFLQSGWDVRSNSYAATRKWLRIMPGQDLILWGGWSSMLLYKICHQFLDRYKSKSLVGKELRMERSCWLAFHRCTATLYYISKSVILSHDTTFYSSFFLRFSQSTNVIFSFLCFSPGNMSARPRSPFHPGTKIPYSLNSASFEILAS